MHTHWHACAQIHAYVHTHLHTHTSLIPKIAALIIQEFLFCSFCSQAGPPCSCSLLKFALLKFAPEAEINHRFGEQPVACFHIPLVGRLGYLHPRVRYTVSRFPLPGRPVHLLTSYVNETSLHPKWWYWLKSGTLEVMSFSLGIFIKGTGLAWHQPSLVIKKPSSSILILFNHAWRKCSSEPSVPSSTTSQCFRPTLCWIFIGSDLQVFANRLSRGHTHARCEN